MSWQMEEEATTATILPKASMHPKAWRPFMLEF
jgi:hypothetical protein